MMLAFAETRARELGRTCIRLYTGEPLTGNIAWYGRHGYAHERTEDMGDRRDRASDKAALKNRGRPGWRED